jgi:molecular chaperone GrpE
MKKVNLGNLKSVSNLQVEELKSQLARALADYDNLRKRTERQREDFSKLANLTLIVKILPVFDMLVIAQKHIGDAGLEIAIGEFREVLKSEEVEEIKVAAGDVFDEAIHEAVEVESGTENKLEAVLSGWKYSDGTVIRPVKVKVTKKGEQKENE